MQLRHKSDPHASPPTGTGAFSQNLELLCEERRVPTLRWALLLLRHLPYLGRVTPTFSPLVLGREEGVPRGFGYSLAPTWNVGINRANVSDRQPISHMGMQAVPFTALGTIIRVELPKTELQKFPL